MKPSRWQSATTLAAVAGVIATAVGTAGSFTGDATAKKGNPLGCPFIFVAIQRKAFPESFHGEIFFHLSARIGVAARRGTAAVQRRKNPRGGRRRSVCRRFFALLSHQSGKPDRQPRALPGSSRRVPQRGGPFSGRFGAGGAGLVG